MHPPRCHPLHIHCLYPQIYVRLGETRPDKGNDRNQRNRQRFCLPTARKYQLDVKLRRMGDKCTQFSDVESKLRVINKVSKSTYFLGEMPRQTPGNQRTRLNFPTVDSAKFCFPDVRVGGFEYFNHLRRYRPLSPTCNQTLIAIQYIAGLAGKAKNIRGRGGGCYRTIENYRSLLASDKSSFSIKVSKVSNRGG